MGTPAGERMRSKSFLSKNWKSIVIVFTFEGILVSLALWTAFSPTYFSAQTKSEIADLFQFAKTTEIVNITDDSGVYSFEFGLDYNSTLSPGIPTIVDAYISLLGAAFHSPLTKGVALQIDDASILFDGIRESAVKQRVNAGQNILFVYLSNVEVNDSSGLHNLSVRLLLSTVYVNYIGYFSGNEFSVTLNGTVKVT